MKVLMTGASGFVGSNVLSYWLEHTDHTFLCPVSLRHHGQARRLPPNRRVTPFYHDLRGVMSHIGKVDIILHIASDSHVDRSIQDPVGVVENNVSSTLQVLEYARRCQPDLFLLFSTDEVYGPHVHETWDVLLPSNPYAASKAAQEMIAIAYWRTYGVPVVITNSNNIVGPGQDPEKFFPKVIGLINAGQPVKVHVTEEGPGNRHYNPVQNVADALLFIVKKRPFKSYTGDRPPRFELPGGVELDNFEVVNLIGKLMDKIPDIVMEAASHSRPGYDQFYAPIQGAELVKLGWKPVISLEDCLKEVIANA
jgi:dTDP-glucose 4,6-dehydratase